MEPRTYYRTTLNAPGCLPDSDEYPTEWGDHHDAADEAADVLSRVYADVDLDPDGAELELEYVAAQQSLDAWRYADDRAGWQHALPGGYLLTIEASETIDDADLLRAIAPGRADPQG